MTRHRSPAAAPENPGDPALAAAFAAGLLHWNHHHNRRSMPWKGEKDPYRIWLSEVILQQTRVEQGLKYYERFIEIFPDVQSLAAAPEAQVFKLWEGLGYYSRCRNLIAAARFIATELQGRFPQHYEQILALKGVGTYTAAAIASFAYNLPYAVLDGNVFRVLSRIYGEDTPVDSTRGKKLFTALAQQTMPPGQAGIYNQAIMDFGALVCKPVPECSACFFSDQCTAFRSGRQDLLPVKEKKTRVRERWFNYFVPLYQDQVAIRQRTTRDIWQNLYEFPLIEADRALSDDVLLEEMEAQYGMKEGTIAAENSTDQRLTHQSIHFRFFHIRLPQRLEIRGCEWIRVNELGQYAFPRTLQLEVERLRV